MDWLFDNLQIILFIILAIAGAMRQFFEGRGEVPVPQPERRTQRPPPQIPREEVESPKLPTVRPPPLKRERTQKPAAAKPARAADATAPVVIRERQESTSMNQLAKPPGATSNIKTTLRSRSELRKAFILREILDAPVSLR